MGEDGIEGETPADAGTRRVDVGPALKIAAAAAILSAAAALFLPPLAATGLRLALAGSDDPGIDPVVVGSTQRTPPQRYTIRHSVLGAGGRDCVVLMPGAGTRSC